MGGFNPPSPPNPLQGMAAGSQVAQNQVGLNTLAGTQSQAGSMVNQYNPYGSIQYGQIGTGAGGIPIYGENTQLTPIQQSLFDVLQGTKGQAGMQGYNTLSNAQYGSNNPSDVIGNATTGNTSALMKMQTDYLNPFFGTQHDQLDTQLKNQGLQPGESAYDNAMRQLQTNQGLVVSNAAAQFEPQAYNQAYQNYQLPLALSQALAGMGTPGSPTSQLVNAPGLNIQPADLVGATATENKMLNDAYAAQMQQYSGMMNGLFGVGSSALGALAKYGIPALGSLGASIGSAAGGGGTAGALLAGAAL